MRGWINDGLITSWRPPPRLIARLHAWLPPLPLSSPLVHPPPPSTDHGTLRPPAPSTPQTPSAPAASARRSAESRPQRTREGAADLSPRAGRWRGQSQGTPRRRLLRAWRRWGRRLQWGWGWCRGLHAMLLPGSPPAASPLIPTVRTVPLYYCQIGLTLLKSLITIRDLDFNCYPKL
jgi:hypothetical protein